MTLQENINYLQEIISQGKVSQIKFVIAEPSSEDNNMPVVDWQVERVVDDQVQLAMDLEFETLEEAIEGMVRDLKRQL